MPVKDINDPRVATTVVKREDRSGGSRDEGTVPAAAGPLEVGTVLTRGADGVLAVLAAGAGDAANCVLLERVPEGNEAQRVVVLWRDADVVRQELRFPTGYVAADADAAIAALRSMGIATRTGV